METHHQVFDQPLDVTASDGEIEITTPDGTTASLTVEAAIASAKRLLQAASLSEPSAGREETYQKPLG